jgi:hypothetical protein
MMDGISRKVNVSGERQSQMCAQRCGLAAAKL